MSIPPCDFLDDPEKKYKVLMAFSLATGTLVIGLSVYAIAVVEAKRADEKLRCSEVVQTSNAGRAALTERQINGFAISAQPEFPALARV